MNLDDIFHRLASEVCGDICGTERHITFSYRINRRGRAIGTGKYIHDVDNNSYAVRVTLGEDVCDNIATMLHELAHHIVFMKYGRYVQSHGHTFYDVYYSLLLKYEAKMPGLIAAEVSYQGKRNGIWLWKALEYKFPGAREVHAFLQAEVDRKNRIYARQYEAYEAARTAHVVNSMFADLDGE